MKNMMKNCSIVKRTLAVAGMTMGLALGAQAQVQIAPVWASTNTVTQSVQLGVIAQRYPWNGMLDINYKTQNVGAERKVAFYANGIKLGTAQGTGGQAATVSFDLNKVADGAFKDKALKDVKITAEIE